MNMIERIIDFDGVCFTNLWGGFSCECSVKGKHTLVIFKDKEGVEKLSLKDEEANDMFDYVLSKYYEKDDKTIEECFSNWLLEYYKDYHEKALANDDTNISNNNVPFVDDSSLSEKYDCLFKDWEKLNSIIKDLCKTIKNKTKYIKKLEKQNRELKREIKKIRSQKQSSERTGVEETI